MDYQQSHMTLLDQPDARVETPTETQIGWWSQVSFFWAYSKGDVN